MCGTIILSTVYSTSVELRPIIVRCYFPLLIVSFSCLLPYDE